MTVADRGHEGLLHPELWVYDGTNPPTMACDIVTSEGGSDGYRGSYPQYLIVYNDKLYFSARPSGEYDGGELYVYDGSNARMLSNVPVSEPYHDGLGPRDFVVFNSKLYFSAADKDDDSELWVYDEAGGPRMAYDIYPGSYTEEGFLF